MGPTSYDTINSYFQVPDQIQMWPIIAEKYKEFGFTDPISDATRIEEYGYITDQFTKFVFRQQSEIEECGNSLERIQKAAASIVPKDRVKATSRKELAYRSLRDEWLMGLRIAIEYEVVEQEGEE